MGIPVLILGQSGSGKSTSMRNFDEKEVQIFNVAGKPLPFRKKLDKKDNANYGLIMEELSKAKYSAYIIDDSQYLMTFAMFAKAKETGYNKFTDMALDFFNLLKYVKENTPPDVIVYFLHHTELAEDGRIKAKTCGKMIDNQLTLEGLFSIVLRAETNQGRYYFETQSNGYTTCKSPMDMFETEIDNDLKFVDTAIREYWEIEPRATSEQLQSLYAAVGSNKEIFVKLLKEYDYPNSKNVLAKDYDNMLVTANALLAAFNNNKSQSA